MTETNLAVIERFYNEMWNERDLADEIISPASVSAAL